MTLTETQVISRSILFGSFVTANRVYGIDDVQSPVPTGPDCNDHSPFRGTYRLGYCTRCGYERAAILRRLSLRRNFFVHPRFEPGVLGL